MNIEILRRREEEDFIAVRPKSVELYRRAYNSLPEGVPTGVCALDPFPLSVDHGQGAYIWDIDGNQYIDYHLGFGATVFGHSHPKIVAALKEQAEKGSHFGAMSEIVERHAAHIVKRFNLSWVRFSTSGSEAVADAIRLARGFSGKSKVVKIEGCYHGSSELAFVSNSFEETVRPLRPGQMPTPRFASKGLSQAIKDVIVVPFNDLERAEVALKRGDVATLILEPILFNVGAIFPNDGYLEGLRRLCDQYGVLLIFDEVKTGVTVSYAGAEELFGVRPDLKVLGKGIGGGLAIGAIGDCRGDLRAVVEDWSVPHLGTFSGNPLAAAAGLAALEEVLTPEAYKGLNRHYSLLNDGFKAAIREFNLDAYFVGAGAKGCLVWSKHKLDNFRDYRRWFNGEFAELTWLYLMNRGVFLSPGQDEQLTFSVMHGEREAQSLLKVFRELLEELSSS